MCFSGYAGAVRKLLGWFDGVAGECDDVVGGVNWWVGKWLSSAGFA